MPLLTPADLAPFATIDPAKAEAMIADAVAIGARVAPCITDDDFVHLEAAKAILRRAVLRWNDSGSGAITQRGAGPFQETIDNRQPHRAMFWPSEISDLQDLCRNGDPSGAFSVDTVATGGGFHADICSLNFGAAYCSCGAVLAGVPLYETS